MIEPADEEMRRQIVAAVREGVREAFAAALDVVLSDAIASGVEAGLGRLWPSEIQEAIHNGMKAAMRERR